MVVSYFEQVLANAGFRLPHLPSNKGEVSMLCPLHKDRHPSFSLNVRTGKWICHAGCGSGGPRSFLRRVLGFDRIQAIAAISGGLSSNELLLDNEEEVERKEKIEVLPEVKFPFRKYVVPDWIFERGFDALTLSKWECGTSEEGSLAIPLKDLSNRTVGWVCRRDPSRLPLVGKYSLNGERSKVLFGAYNVRERWVIEGTPHVDRAICLVEGPLDAMWLDQHDIASVALLGVYMSKTHENILNELRPSEVILCLDNDTAGKEGQQKIVDKIKNSYVLTSISLPQGCKDVQDVRDARALCTTINKRFIA